MYSIDDIYALIDSTATTTKTLFPTEAYGSSMHSISELYVKLANLIQAEDLASTSVTYLGVTGGEATPDPVSAITKEFTPTSPAGTTIGYTLEDIYDLIENNNRITTPAHDFSPASAPITGTMHSLSNIYSTLSGLIQPGDIATGTTYLGVTGTYYEDFTVVFDAQGGTPAFSTTTDILYNATTTLPTPPTKDGFTFSGWYTEPAGAGTQFTDSTAVTASITVYAKWTVKLTLYFCPAVDGNWETLGNWFTDGGCISAYGGAAAPWTANDASKDYDLYIISDYLYISSTIGNGFTITGSLSSPGSIDLYNNGIIYGGTFIGSVFARTDGTINGGTFTGPGFTNGGTINDGNFSGSGFTNGTQGAIFGGTFSGDGFINNSDRQYSIVGGTFTGSGFVNNAFIFDGNFSGSGFVNNGGIFDGNFSGSGFTNGTYGALLGGTYHTSLDNTNGWIEGNIDVWYPIQRPVGGTGGGEGSPYVTYHGYP